jgi:hypothetical protein
LQYVLVQSSVNFSYTLPQTKIFSVGWVVGGLGPKMPVLATQAQAKFLDIF